MPVSKGERDKQIMPKPYWTSDCGRVVIYVGDCLEVMAAMEPDQFHAVVTDPPYGLEFMGKDWDAPWKQDGSVDARQRRADEMSDPVKAKYLRHNTTYGMSDSRGFQSWFLPRAEEMLRVAKPGAHLLSFGGTRMWHRMACAVEDAGWEIRDTVMWVYGSGFPKGLDVGKAIDKLLGAERDRRPAGSAVRAGDGTIIGLGHSGTVIDDEPITDAARQWSGWNTALKPAYEPIVLARSSVVGSVAQNTLDHGCGGLNIDGCRVGTTGEVVAKHVPTRTSAGSGVYGFNTGKAGDVTMNGNFSKTQKDGRHPPNLIHDGGDEVLELFPDAGGGFGRSGNADTAGELQSDRGWGTKKTGKVIGFGDSGSAARFFYTAKADDGDRPHGRGSAIHPTVKPLDLMRYLVRLVCARGGKVIDPFMGSGSTGCAAVEEGMWFVGVEKSQEYADLAVGRLKLSLAKCPSTARLETGRRVDGERDTPPPPRRMRG